MRILILHSAYLSGSISGENRVVSDESRLLREAGHEVQVWAPSPDISRPFGRLQAGMSSIWSNRAAHEVRAMVRRRRIQVVHVHNLFPTLSPSVLRAARSEGAAVFVTLHNFRLMCLPADLLRDGRVCEDCVGHLPWRGVVHRCYRGSVLGSAALAGSLSIHRALGTFDAVDRFLAVSAFVRDKYIEAGMRQDRILVKPNFTWPAPRRSGPGDYFLSAGRLSSEKGIDTLLSAWRIAQPSMPLVILGDGPDAQRLMRDAPDGVEFRGEVSPSEVALALTRARALMVPSRWYEAAPRAIVEAYAAGVPVIASDIGALPEAVIDGVTGRLVPPDDPEAWGEVSRALDEIESERLGAGAFRMWEERSSPQRGLGQLEACYRGETVSV